MCFDRLPNFYIIGAAKAGTTTVYDALKQHPLIGLSFPKEPYFWGDDEKYSNGLSWYLDRFFSPNINEYPIRGDASTQSLFWSKKVSLRLRDAYREYSDNLKFLVIFRNPVHRAYSHYWMNIRYGWEDAKTFEEAIHLETVRFSEHFIEWERQGNINYGYLQGGYYASQIRPFLALFRKEQFLFLLQEDLRDNFQGTINKILVFLNLEPNLNIAPAVSNPAMIPRSFVLVKFLKTSMPIKAIFKPFFSEKFRTDLKRRIRRWNLKPFRYPKMSSDLERDLTRHFFAEIKDLEVLIDRDLSHWYSILDRG